MIGLTYSPSYYSFTAFIIRMCNAMIVFIVLFCLSSAFNLDSKSYKIVKGPKNTLFGLSAVLIKNSQTWLIVGAPDDTTSGIISSGTVYQCPVEFSSSSQTASCSVALTIIAETVNHENRTNQNLGSVIERNEDGSKFTVCAPRYITKFTYCGQREDDLDQNLQGRCFEFDNTFGQIQELKYCTVSNWKSIQPTNDNTNLENFPRIPSCLQVQGITNTQGRIEGQDFSLSLDWRNNEIRVGGDCTKTLQCLSTNYLGISLFITSSHEEIRFYCKGYDIFRCKGTVGKSLSKIQGFQKYWDGVGSNARKYRPKSVCLLGQSVGYRNGGVILGAPGFDWKGEDFTGAMFSDIKNTLARSAGINLMGLAYHSATFGNVIFDAVMGKKDYITGMIDILKNDAIIQSILGEDYGEDFSQFGFDVKFVKCGIKLELLISAPFSKGPTPDQFDCGKVYVFQFNSNNNNFTHRGSLADVCGRFGYSIGLLGDIDNDGYNDVAISAPGSQNIAIYQGSQDGINFENSQIINVGGKVNSFGHKITSINADDDYTMIGVTDPMSDKVYVFKSLPVVKLNKIMSCGNGRWNIHLLTNISCSICFDIKPIYNPKNLPDTEFNVSIQVEISSKILKINPTPKVISNLVINTTKTCQSLNLVITDTRNITMEKEVQLNVNYTYQNFNNRGVAIQPSSLQDLTYGVKLEGMCGDSQCTGDFSISLTVLVQRSGIPEKYKNLIENFSDINSVLYRGSGLESVVVALDLSVLDGEMYDEIVNISVPYGFNLSNKSSLKSSDSGDVIELGRWYEFPADRISNLTELIFDITEDSYRENQVQISAKVISFINKGTDLTNNMDSVLVSIKKIVETSSYTEVVPAHIEYRLRLGVFTQKSLNGYGPSQLLKILLANKGPNKIDALKIVVLYPVESEGVEVIYIAKLEFNSGLASTCDESTAMLINYKGLPDTSEMSRNLPRAGKPKTEPCSHNSWKCVKLTCTIYNISSSSETGILVTSYVNPQAETLGIFNFTVEYTTEVLDMNTVDLSTSRFFSVTTVIQLSPATVSGFWFYLGGVVAATMILSVIVGVLYKCGFFKREKKEELKLMRQDNNTVDSLNKQE